MILFKRLRAAMVVCVVSATMWISAAPRAEAQDTPMLGQMLLFAGNFCPRNYTAADGKLLAISSNQALFSILGTFYGGDGRTTFGVPDLRGRVPLSVGQGPGLPNPGNMGAKGGSATKTLTIPEMPSHNHMVNSTFQTADKNGPGTDFLAVPNQDGLNIYHNGPADRQMDPAMIANTGGSQSFSIQNPYQVMQWCIATQGLFPSRS